MTEDEARAWLAERFDVPRETWAALEAYVGFLVEEAGRQNLIAASTLGQVWARHVVDSAQLLCISPLPFRGGVGGGASTRESAFVDTPHPNPSPQGEGLSLFRWLDLGSGAGLPGLVIAALTNQPVTLVESRRKRVQFLEEAAARMGIADRVTVIGTRLEVMPSAPFAVISARAFAPLERLLALAHRFATRDTLWLLPKGKSAASELAEVRRTWQGDFRIVASVTDPEAGIIVASGVQPRTGR
jgi:16S rRNA (guanine527-N7)-methyltransferase